MQLIDLRTPKRDRLVGQFDPVRMRLIVVHRGERCEFDLGAMATGRPTAALPASPPVETDDPKRR